MVMSEQDFLRRGVALAILIAAVTACGSLDPHLRVPDEHIVMVNYRGNPVDPTSKPVLGIGHYREASEPEFEKHLERVIGHIAEFASDYVLARDGNPLPPRPAPVRGVAVMTDVSEEFAKALKLQQKLEPGQNVEYARRAIRNPRVVLFIHGGLNTQAGSVKRAVERHGALLDDGVYPVFVNWQSSLFSSYWDHLFLIRFGEERPWRAWLTAPFVIGEDFFRALGRAPMTLWNEIGSAFETTNFYDSPNQKVGRQLADDALGKIDVDFPEAHRDPGSGPLVLARDIVLMLPHMVLGVLLDIGGTSSWEEMHRRTTLTMESESSYRADSVAPPAPSSVPRLFTELRHLQDRLKEQGIELQVDIISHSMGCIISNLLLQTAGSKNVNGVAQAAAGIEGLPVFTNIVYMADADSVQKTERAVYTYMLGPGHSHTNFFMLSLNDRAEVAETTGWYLAPKGSLLVWIDHFFEATPSMPDERAGRLENQLFSLHRIPTALRTRVHAKSFLFQTNDPKTNPVEHGDFSEGKFWRPEYFTPRHAR